MGTRTATAAGMILRQKLYIDRHQYISQKKSSPQLIERFQDARAQRRQRGAIHKIVGEQPMPLAINQAGSAQELQVMRDSRLFHRERRLQITDTNLPVAARQHRQNLDTNGMCDAQESIGKLLCLLRAELLVDPTAAAFTQCLSSWFKCQSH